MVLNSVVFILFLSVVATAYYLLPHIFRNGFLLIASYMFYIWTVKFYAVVLLFATIVSYAVARQIDKPQSQKRRKAWLWTGIGICLLVLCVFKYAGAVFSTFQLRGWVPEDTELPIIFPLGISFYTFQVVGYMIDVYNKKIQHEHNLVTYALFVSFFPQLLSGPIGRGGEMLPQYREQHAFQYDNVVAGMQRFLVGAMKKVVIADGLSIIVYGVYGKLPDYQGLTLIIAAVLFAIQIYFDFSGYTDMAVGAALILGFKLRENFKAPYRATNMSGFWLRWHMSLTTWLTDYVFTPLVWSRWANKLAFGKKWDEHKPHIITNLVLVFLISGIWHGSTLNFVIWGLLHGLIRASEELVMRKRKKTKRDGFFVRAVSGCVDFAIFGLFRHVLWKWVLPASTLADVRTRTKAFVTRNLKRAGVFFVSAVTLIFFAAATPADAWYVFRNIPRNISLGTTAQQILHLAANGISDTGMYYAIYFGFIAVALCIAASLDRRVYDLKASNNALATYKKKQRWLLYWIMGIMVMLFYFIALTGFRGSANFIYTGI